MKDNVFSQRVLTWFHQHGRKHLPWQQHITPYRVWVSEIMLQQTQVSTVIPYFERFIARFPHIDALANASLDEVLHHWTGLGYYARARNLHRTAQIIHTEHHDIFPADVNALENLPGIGRSTAGAILAIAFQQRAAILDGNVKRVLARYHAVAGWPGQPSVLNQLWDIAERYTPKMQIADYTQAMMDLGSLICTRTKPRCEQCPLRADCAAYQQHRTHDYPGRKPAKQLPIKSVYMIIVQNSAGHVLLEQRPPTGIWGSLWSFPECVFEEDVHAWCQQRLGFTPREIQSHPSFRHTFSHFHLDITPLQINMSHGQPPAMESAKTVWYNIAQPDARGLAAPVKQLLLEIAS